MVASAAVPGLLLCTAATILLIFVCVSSPTWNSVYFLDAGARRYGVFGFTGSKTMIGYDFIGTNNNLNTKIINNLTKTLILHPIAAVLAGLSVIFGLCGASAHRSGTIFMTILASLATVVTFVAFVIDMVLFGIARNKLRDAGTDASYGNACWLTLGALVALLLGFCLGACGVFGRYRTARRTKNASY
ncbi:pali-domain-containing protein [Mycena floridula]|nr:pali-domain-containing protein [Mycena floridula]